MLVSEYRLTLNVYMLTDYKSVGLLMSHFIFFQCNITRIFTRYLKGLMVDTKCPTEIDVESGFHL